MDPSCEAEGTNVFHCLDSVRKEQLLWGGQRVQAQMSYPWSWQTLNRATGPEHLGWLLRYLALGWIRRAQAFLFPPAQNSFSAHPHCILQIIISWDSLKGQGQVTLPKQAPGSLLLSFLNQYSLCEAGTWCLICGSDCKGTLDMGLMHHQILLPSSPSRDLMGSLSEDLTGSFCLGAAPGLTSPQWPLLH